MFSRKLKFSVTENIYIVASALKLETVVSARVFRAQIIHNTSARYPNDTPGARESLPPTRIAPASRSYYFVDFVGICSQRVRFAVLKGRRESGGMHEQGSAA